MREVLYAVQNHQMNSIQFNLSCASLPSLPRELAESELIHLHDTLSQSGIKVAAVSGTFNMIHPIHEQRELGLIGLETIAKAAHLIGTNVITLCTGSRDGHNMWSFHPENNSEKAWTELLVMMEKALKIAEKYNVILGVEPELSNVVNTAEKAKKLLDLFPSERLKIIMDGANLIPLHQTVETHSILNEAFDLLGDHIVLAHAKDFSIEQGAFVAAGQGDFDYDHYISLLKSVHYNGSLILHSLNEEQVPESYSFLEKLL